MNGLGGLVLDAAVHTTGFALIGIVVYGLLRRWGPGVSSLVALETLVLLVGVSSLSALGWPAWWSISPERLLLPQRSGQVSDFPASASFGEVRGTVDKVAAQPEAPRPEVRDAVDFRAIGREFLKLRIDAPRSRWMWRAWFGVVFLTFSLFGLFRLGVGAVEVRRLTRESRPIDDPRLRDRLEILRAAMSCRRSVAIHESSLIATPATVGWTRPLILLPPTWTDWTDFETAVVLAHEMAHVCRADYRSGLMAHASVALHFANPLAHWLLGRMRLQQELAADAWAAQIAGGNVPYLTALAQMALRQADQPLSWPARAFLPSRGTFLRRIEMLRDFDGKTPWRTTVSRPFRAGTIGGLAALGCLVAGIRGGVGPERVVAQTAPPPANSPVTGTSKSEYDMKLVPAATDLVVGLRPSVLLAQPGFRPLVDAITRGNLSNMAPRLPYEELDQILFLWLRPSAREAPSGPARGKSAPSVTILQSIRPRDWKQEIATLIGKTTTVTLDGKTYERAIEGPARYSAFRSGDRGLILASEVDLAYVLHAAANPSNRHPWDNAWNQVDAAPVSMAFGANWLGKQVQREVKPGSAVTSVQVEAFSPLWNTARGYAVAIDVAKGLSLEVAASVFDDAGLERLDQTGHALVTLMGNILSGYQREIDKAPREAVEKMQFVVDTLEPLLKSIRWEKRERIDQGRTEKVLHAQTSSSLDVEKLVPMFLPALSAANAEAGRYRSVNNMKQLGLAMFNYLDVNGRFPPAVLMGPDGKTPYSWRVALLPFLEQKALYDQYKFDEPWDGPNNRKLLSKMPSVFRFGEDPADTNAAYFALVGPRTVFNGPEGMELRKIVDGPGKTLMLVEAKREIPWTRPEDIPYEAARPLPELGGLNAGGFNVLFADGSVKFLKSSINETVLRALITAAGGEALGSASF